jgi:SH3-like domain-containing protein
VERRSFDGRGSWGHDGSLSGFRSAIRYFPASGGVTIAVMTNSDRVDPDTLVGSLLEVLYPLSP